MSADGKRSGRIRRFVQPVALGVVLAAAALSVCAGEAWAELCYPEKAPANLIGRYFVYEAVSASGSRRLHTSVIAGRSDEGGLITCFYDGRPGALGDLKSILATDETYSYAWSVDVPTGRRTVSTDQERACDLGGLGPCASTRRSSRPGKPSIVQEFDRRCEKGAFVKLVLRTRAEGGDPQIRAIWNEQMARAPQRRHEILYRKDGAILRSSVQIGEAVGAPSVLIEEGDWTGPNCLPSQTS